MHNLPVVVVATIVGPIFHDFPEVAPAVDTDLGVVMAFGDF